MWQAHLITITSKSLSLIETYSNTIKLLLNIVFLLNLF